MSCWIGVLLCRIVQSVVIHCRIGLNVLHSMPLHCIAMQCNAIMAEFSMT